MHKLVAGVGLLRAPIAVTLATVCLLLLPAQTLEIFRSLQDASDTELVIEWLRCFVWVSIFIFALAITSVTLVAAPPPNRREATANYRNALEALALGLPTAVAIAFTMVNASAFLAGFRQEASKNPDQLSYFEYVLYWHGFFLAATVIGAILATVMLYRAPYRRSTACRLLLGVGSSVRLNLISGILAIAAAILCAISATYFAQNTFSLITGPIGVVFLFLSLLLICSSQLAYLYDKRQWPVIAILVSLAAIWAYIPTNNNHQIRLAKNTAEPEDLVTAFKEWLRNRDWEGRSAPYPIYIVTAEGGGIYAAAHAAWTLARIQDACPAFAKHVFAISSVSGGSVGAGLFAGLIKADPFESDACSARGSADTRFQESVKRFFTQDFLTPLVSSGLFPDFFQRFWPLGIDAFDRARALESSLHDAWTNALPVQASRNSDKLFHQSLSKLWAPQLDMPALLMNTTLVQNGERVILSPFRLRAPSVHVFPDRFIDILNGDYQPELATAIGISARFPIVTPPALHWHPEYKLAAQLVDGGYYDNSGVATAINLIDSLRRGSNSSDVKLKFSASNCAESNLIRVTKEEFSTKKTLSEDDYFYGCIKLITIRAVVEQTPDSTAGDISSIFPALLRTRIARGVGTLALAYNLHCGGTLCGRGKLAHRPHIYVKYLDVGALELPLGWHLTNNSFAKIFTSPQADNDCRSQEEFDVEKNDLINKENGCLITRVAQDIFGWQE
jgi:hypothetical protein